jgi:SRSO17 transposase
MAGMTNEIICPSIDEYMAPYMSFFRRSEGRALAESYVCGLLMDGERKSVEPMSERVNASERSMQRLLTQVTWDEQGVLSTFQERMLAATSDPKGLLLIDDTSFPKKGRESVCVARQYCGATGKTDNCQVGVSMSYIGQGVAWPFGMKLFVPESWDNGDAECMQRRAKTKMPESVHNRPKWRIALELLDEATSKKIPHWAVVADSWYGNIPEFRQELVKRGERYILGVYANTQVFLESPTVEYLPQTERKRGHPRKKAEVLAVSPKPIKVSAVGAAIADDAWQHLEIRRDSRNKPLVVEAVSLRVYPAHGWRNGAVHEEVWLLIERRHLTQGEVELRYFFSNMPQTMPTLTLVQINHERYWIEQGYQQLKEELGLDHHEGRSWLGWHRHVLLTFLAYGYLTLIRLEQKKLQNLSMWRLWLQHQGILEKEYFV